MINSRICHVLIQVLPHLIAALERNRIEMTGGSRRACRTYLSAENWVDGVLFWGEKAAEDETRLFEVFKKQHMQRVKRNPGLWFVLR